MSPSTIIAIVALILVALLMLIASSCVNIHRSEERRRDDAVLTSRWTVRAAAPKGVKARMSDEESGEEESNVGGSRRHEAVVAESARNDKRGDGVARYMKNYERPPSEEGFEALPVHEARETRRQ